MLRNSASAESSRPGSSSTSLNRSQAHRKSMFRHTPGGGAYDAAYSILYLIGMDQSTDLSLDVDANISPQAKDLLQTALTGCLTQLYKVATDEHLDPTSAFSASRANLLPIEVANEAFPSAKFSVPIFTGTGLADTEAGTAAQYNFIADLCASGTTVSWHYYPGLTHNGAVNGSLVDSAPIVQAVMSGGPIASNCSGLAIPGPLQSPTPGVPYNT